MTSPPARESPATRARRSAYRHGHGAEILAALMLLAKGFRVLARRYKTPVGEIDLVVKRRRLIAFVEVKARRSEADARVAIDAVDTRRIIAASDLWLAKHPDATGLDLRYDIVLVVPGRLPRHLPDAFRAGW